MRDDLREAHLRGVLDRSRDAIVSVDGQGRIAFFNRAAERMFDHPAAEVLGQSVAKLMPDPYRNEHYQYLENYKRTGLEQVIGRILSAEGRRKNGDRFPFELAVYEDRVDDEVVYTTIISNTTERLRAEDKLRDRETKIRTSVDATVDGIITIDGGGIEAFRRGAEEPSTGDDSDGSGCTSSGNWCGQAAEEQSRSGQQRSLTGRELMKDVPVCSDRERTNDVHRLSSVQAQSSTLA